MAKRRSDEGQEERRTQRLLAKEVGEEAGALGGEETFGVELDAVDGHGFVADTHEFVAVGPGGDFEVGGEGGSIEGKGVVTSGRERIGQAIVHAFAVMMDGAGFSVHQP